MDRESRVQLSVETDRGNVRISIKHDGRTEFRIMLSPFKGKQFANDVFRCSDRAMAQFPGFEDGDPDVKL